MPFVSTHIYIHTYIHTYIYIYVCVCVYTGALSQPSSVGAYGAHDVHVNLGGGYTAANPLLLVGRDLCATTTNTTATAGLGSAARRSSLRADGGIMPVERPLTRRGDIGMMYREGPKGAFLVVCMCEQSMCAACAQRRYWDNV